MRALMGLIKDRHGTWCAQQRVPKRLQVAVARLLGKGKPKQVYLKRSLATKDLRSANIRAKPVQMEFDRILRDAGATVRKPSGAPQARSSLNATEIRLMADYVYATTLAWDERWRVGGREELRRSEAELREILKHDGRELGALAYSYQELPPHGWSGSQLANSRAELDESLPSMREALALGDVSAVQDEVLLALHAFGIDLALDSLSRPLLGIATLRAYVRALQAIGQRNDGSPVETPEVLITAKSAPEAGGTSPNFLMIVASPKSPVAGSPVRLKATAPTCPGLRDKAPRMTTAVGLKHSVGSPAAMPSSAATKGSATK
jgi:hypothetical protein